MSINSFIDGHKREFVGLFAAMVLWSLFFFYVEPKTAVEAIGIRNRYLSAFLISAFGGVSSFTGATSFTAIAFFGAAGLNPFFLALVSGLGFTLGDSFFFYLGHKGRYLLSDFCLSVYEFYSFPQRHSSFGTGSIEYFIQKSYPASFSG